MSKIINRPFEAAGRSLGASPDELKLVFSFLLSYPLAGRTALGTLGPFPLLSSSAGFALMLYRKSSVSTFYVLGLLQLYDGFRTILISAAVTYAIAKYLRSSPYMPWIGFVFLMGHMSVSHIKRQQVERDTPSHVDITGAQMVMVMKLTAFCWNVADGRLPEDQLSDLQKDRMLKEIPPILDYAGYVLFFPSLLAGPAFDYAEYRRWIDTTMFDISPKVDPSKKPPVRKRRKIPRSGTPATWKALTGLGWIGLFMYLGPKFDCTELLSDTYTTLSLPRRIWIMHLVNFTARLKYYGVWALTEGACILTGLGYNGIDEVTGKVSWNRLQNVDPWMVETAQNARAYLGGWNMNTNSWLRNYVYLRVTPRGKKPGFRASLMTFGTSAFWHGFYPGYYLTFILGSLIQTAAKNFRRHVRPFFLNPLNGEPTPYKRYYDLVCYFMTQLSFSFTTTPFLVLSLQDSFHAWRNVYLYALIWVVTTLSFFASPGKPWLQKRLETRVGKMRGRLSRTVSTESVTGKEPILGMSRDLEEDIADAMEELQREMGARQSGANKGRLEPKKSI